MQENAITAQRILRIKPILQRSQTAIARTRCAGRAGSASGSISYAAVTLAHWRILRENDVEPPFQLFTTDSSPC